MFSEIQTLLSKCVLLYVLVWISPKNLTLNRNNTQAITNLTFPENTVTIHSVTQAANVGIKVYSFMSMNASQFPVSHYVLSVLPFKHLRNFTASVFSASSLVKSSSLMYWNCLTTRYVTVELSPTLFSVLSITFRFVYLTCNLIINVK